MYGLPEAAQHRLEQHMDRYIYICPCAAPTCVVLLQAAHTFCVSVLYVHVVFDDKHVLNLMCVHACIYVYSRSSKKKFFFFFF